MSSYKDGEVLSSNYRIWISGSELDINKKACITSINMLETVDGSDTCSINISDPEFLFIEDNIFIEDNSIKIQMGWSDVTTLQEFTGYISAIDIDFPENGVPKLVITCMDDTHLMNREKKNRTFKNTSNDKVVEQIVKSYGFNCVIESGYDFEVKETITQSNQTDINFITNLAGEEVYPFTARLVGKTFYYVKKGKLGTPKTSLTYMSYPHEIISFSPKINKETIQVEVGSSVLSSDKKVETSSISSSKTTDSKTGKGGGTTNNSNSSYTYNPNK